MQFLMRLLLPSGLRIARLLHGESSQPLDKAIAAPPESSGRLRDGAGCEQFGNVLAARSRDMWADRPAVYHGRSHAMPPITHPSSVARGPDEGRYADRAASEASAQSARQPASRGNSSASIGPHRNRSLSRWQKAPRENLEPCSQSLQMSLQKRDSPPPAFGLADRRRYVVRTRHS